MISPTNISNNAQVYKVVFHVVWVDRLTFDSEAVIPLKGSDGELCSNTASCLSCRLLALSVPVCVCTWCVCHHSLCKILLADEFPENEFLFTHFNQGPICNVALCSKSVTKSLPQLSKVNLFSSLKMWLNFHFVFCSSLFLSWVQSWVTAAAGS